MRYANTTDPSVPEALSGIVGGFVGLNNFRPKMNARVANATPDFNSGSSHYLSPADFATIYDVKPLYTAGYDGTGQSIAIVGESDISLTDIRGFRSDFGLTAMDPKLILYGNDPGFTGAQIESDLDIEWSGAVAQKATIYYVYGQSAFTALTVAVSANVAPVISVSFGSCENDVDVPSWRTVAQEANAQGITIVNSSGDAGGAGCDIQGDLSLATHGLSAQFPADIPEVTGVGGTMFNEGTGSYWNSVNSLTNGTALSYIPELAWNESSLANGLAATGGGASRVFTKPDWQTGPGVPADGARDVPDISFSAAIHDSYLITLNSGTGLIAVAGTSAAAPSMAGIVALLNQYVVKQGIQKTAGVGNINPQLYRLAQVAPAAFHDVTGGSNLVPCEQGTPTCLTGTVGYSAGAGYDQTTGLGSLDANVFVTSWKTSLSAATVSATASPASATINGTVTVTATVKAASGSGTPTGTVSFAIYGTALGSAVLAPVGGVQTAAVTFPSWMLGKGISSVYVAYAGDGAFSGASATVRVPVTVPSNVAAVIPSANPSPVYAVHSWTEPPTWQTTISLAEIAGVPALLTGFTLDGQAQSLSQYFPSTNIPANGTLQASIVLQNLTVPANHVLGFTGTDAGGNQWSRQLSVPFVGGLNQAISGFITWATPLAMQQNTAAPASCQWSQQITIDGTGYAQRIVSLQRGPVDITSSVASIFGTTRLAAWGSISGTLCWSNATAPGTDGIFIETTDDFGDYYAQTLNVTFAGPPSSSVQLSVSPTSLTLKPSTVPVFQQPLTLNVGLSSTTQQWNAAVYPANQTTSWLQLSQYAGAGPAAITAQASAAGFEPGVYRATVIVQSPGATPEWVSVPVMWVNSSSTPGPTISSVSNGLSFTQGASPGMLMGIYGSGLASSTAAAKVLPLSNSLGGVSVTVNGWPAPLLYVSPTQINIQVPYEAGAGPAVLGVNNNGQIAGYLFTLNPSAPGILSVNGSISPSSTAKQGAYATMYVTGMGDVNPSILTGFPVQQGTPLNSLPLPLLPVSVTVGGTPALLQFAGLTPGVVGLAQVNFIVPPTVATGTQPVVVTVNGVASAPANITVTAGP